MSPCPRPAPAQLTGQPRPQALDHTDPALGGNRERSVEASHVIIPHVFMKMISMSASWS